MKISIKSNIEQVRRNLSAIQQKQIPYAASRALNDLAYDLTKRSGGGELGQSADKTFKKKSGQSGADPYTKRGFFYTKSSKKKLTTTVFWDEKRGDYMEFMVAGGTRFPKKKALLVSTEHSSKYLDSYGNFKKSAVNQLLADKGKFFVGSPKGAKSYAPGIWERYGRQTKKGGQKIRMVAAYEKSGKYRPLFPFARIVDTFVFSRSGFANRFNKHLQSALAKSGSRVK